MKPNNRTAQHDKDAAYCWGRSVGEMYRINRAKQPPTSRGTGLRGASRLCFDSGAIAGFTSPRQR